LPNLAARTGPQIKASLDSFERLCKPGKVASIKTQTIDRFIAARKKDPGQKRGDLVSPATVNHDLRHLKAVLAVAVEWGYLDALPKIHFLKEPKKLARHIIPEHFAALYQACDTARMPEALPFPAAEWWRAILVLAYMTGWRLGDILGLKREDVDLEKGTPITRWDVEGNKGKRDDLVNLPAVVVEHLKKLVAFDRAMFPWPHNRRTIDEELLRIQKAAGITLPCRKDHEHKDHCHAYGFHDLRRGFATMNASRLWADALQALMRHKSYQMEEAAEKVDVPDFLQPERANRKKEKRKIGSD
jgi:integrase